MIPFSVHCETCGVKLKVRDPASIGEIHACPRCDSMVLIASPSDGTGDWSTAATLATAALPLESAIPADFASEVEGLLQSPESPIHTDPAQAAPAQAAEVIQESSGDLLPPTEFPPTAGHRGAMIWGTASLVAFFAAGVLGAVWWSRGGNEAANGELVQEATATLVETEKAFSPPDASAPVAVKVSKPSVPEPVEMQTEPTAPPAAIPPTESAAPLPELPSLPALEEPALGEEVASSSAKRQAVREANEKPMPLLDPLAIDSANLDLLLVPELVQENDAAKNRAAEATPPQVVAEIESQEGPPRIAIASPKIRRFEPGSSRRGPSFAEAFAEGEFPLRLSTRLPSVKWTRVPMHRVFAELGSLVGVPITIDPAALRGVALTASEPVSLVQEDTTALQIASAIAKKVRLTVEEQAGGLVLVKAEADRLREIEYRIDDLQASGSDESRDMAALIQAFVEPGSWSDDRQVRITTGTGSLAIQHRAAVHYEILLFCERLRKARGLSTRSRYPSELIFIEPRLARLSDRLSRRTTFTFVDWTPLAQVFEYWQETSGVTTLIDWRALADQGARPQATMAGSVNNLSWSEALDVSLHPLNLDWTPVDGETIQITTRQRARDAVWVEFYMARSSDELRSHIAESCDEASLVTLVLQADATGKFVLVRGNRQVHQAVTTL